MDFASTWEKIDDGVQSPEGSSPTSAATQAEPSGQAEAQSSAEASAQADAPSQEAASGEPAAESGDTAGAGEFSYASLVGQEFLFSSGAGGWGTVMTVYMDGSFTGNFHDSEMGDMGDDYPNGTVYYCDFRGSFGGLTKVDDYTYKTTLKNLVYDKTPETEEIKDGIRYCYSTAYGLEATEDLYFYLPGKPLDEIPEVFFAWVQMAKDTAENGKLTMYALYNEAQEYAFGAYPAYDAGNDEDSSAAEEGADSTEVRENGGASSSDAALTADQLKASLENTQKASDELESRMQNEDMNQMQLNDASAELYALWDDQLNEIWG